MFEIIIKKENSIVTASFLYNGEKYSKSFEIGEYIQEHKKGIINACLAMLSIKECERKKIDSKDTETWLEVKKNTKIIDKSNL